MRILVVLFICLPHSGLSEGDPNPPRITSLRSESNLIKLQTNHVLTLKCTAAGQDPLEYRWQHNGVTIIPQKVDRISTFEGTIVIGSLRPEDEGRYRCVVSNPLGMVFSRDIVVQFSYVNDFVLPDTDENVKTVQAQLGQPLQLDCPAYRRGNKVQHYWGTVDSDTGTVFLLPVGNRVAVDGAGNLVYAWLKQEDADTIQSKGGISCILGNNDNSEIRVSHRYMINVTDDASLSDVSPQIVEKLLTKYDVAKGGSLRLRCTATGRPTPSMSWFKNGRKISSSAGYKIQEAGRELLLDPVLESMAAEYKCVAKSTTSTGNELEASSTATVHVKTKPVWLRKPDKYHVDVFMSKTYLMECRATGSPSISYTWYKDARKLDIRLAKYRVSGYKLLVQEVSYEDQGVYQCVAENDYGKIIAVQYLNVVPMPPSFDDVEFGPFKIYMGHKAVLKCNPEAAPKPSRSQKTWAKNGKDIAYDGKKYMQNIYGDLIIFDVDTDDAANYTCSVETTAGRSQATASAIISSGSPSSDGCSLHAVVWMRSMLSFIFLLTLTSPFNVL